MKDIYILEWKKDSSSRSCFTSFHLIEADMDEFISETTSDFDESYINDVASI